MVQLLAAHCTFQAKGSRDPPEIQWSASAATAQFLLLGASEILLNRKGSPKEIGWEIVAELLLRETLGRRGIFGFAQSQLGGSGGSHV